MNKVKLFLFKKIAERQKKKNPRTKSFVSYERAQRILILFELKQAEEIDAIKEIITELNKDKKEVLALGFSNTKNKIVSETKFLEIYNNKSISFLSKPKKNIIKKMRSLEFDLLIDLSSENNIFLSYLSLYTNALMKVSSKIKFSYIFDFMLNISEDEEINEQKSAGRKNQILFKKINFYLKSIEIMD